MRVLVWIAQLLQTLLMIAAGAWLIVFSLWDGWPEGQLTEQNGIIAGAVLAGVGVFALGAVVGWVFPVRRGADEGLDDADGDEGDGD